MPRLNKVIELIEQGKCAFGPFTPAGSIPDAVWIASTQFDAVVFEMEHGPFDLNGLKTSFQFLMAGPGRDTSALQKGRQLAGR